MPLYAESALLKRFEQIWAKSGKKLDMGKCCIRFKKVEDLDFGAIQDLLVHVTAEKYVAQYLANLSNQSSRKTAAKKSTPNSELKNSTKKKAAPKPSSITAAAKQTGGGNEKAAIQIKKSTLPNSIFAAKLTEVLAYALPTVRIGSCKFESCIRP